MESINEKLLKVFIAFDITKITDGDPIGIAKIFQKIDHDVILLSDFFEKEYSLKELFNIYGDILLEEEEVKTISYENENIKRALTRTMVDEWFISLNKCELYQLEKNALIIMLESLDAPAGVRHTILKDLSEENASRFFEQVYEVFAKRNAYFSIIKD